MLNKLRTEPVAVVAFVQAVLAMVLGFWPDLLTTEQLALIVTVTGSGLALLARSQVAPKPPAG